MIRLKMLNPEVYVADEPIVHLGREEIEFLKSKVYQTEHKRIRICAHKDNNDRFHEMIIAFSKQTYLRPSQHINKEESLHVVEGLGEYLFFDSKGKITEVIPLGDAHSGRQFYCRIPANTYHALMVHSELMVVQEVTHGPFNKADTVFASWSPEEKDGTAIEEYIKKLHADSKNFCEPRYSLQS